MRRFAPAGRRSLSRLVRCRVFPTSGKVPSTVFQRLELLSECGLIPPLVASGFVDFHPVRVSSAVFAGLRSLSRGDALADERPPPPVHSTRRKPSLQTRPPKPPGNSPRVCAYGANVAAICSSGGKTCRALFSFSRPAPLRLARAGRRWGPPHVRGPWSGFAGFTPRASVTPRRDAVSCRLLCATFTGCGRNMPASAGKEVGRLRTCFVFHLGRS